MIIVHKSIIIGKWPSTSPIHSPHFYPDQYVIDAIFLDVNAEKLISLKDAQRLYRLSDEVSQLFISRAFLKSS